jgi:hypothetical protein
VSAAGRGVCPLSNESRRPLQNQKLSKNLLLSHTHLGAWREGLSLSLQNWQQPALSAPKESACTLHLPPFRKTTTLPPTFAAYPPVIPLICKRTHTAHTPGPCFSKDFRLSLRSGVVCLWGSSIPRAPPFFDTSFSFPPPPENSFQQQQPHALLFLLAHREARESARALNNKNCQFEKTNTHTQALLQPSGSVLYHKFTHL